MTSPIALLNIQRADSKSLKANNSQTLFQTPEVSSWWICTQSENTFGTQFSEYEIFKRINSVE